MASDVPPRGRVTAKSAVSIGPSLDSINEAIDEARRGSVRGVFGWLSLALAVVIIDQWSKDLVLQHFKLAERLPVIAGFFDLTLLYNPGAAFSFLGSASGWQRWFFTALGVVASIFIVVLVWRHRGQRLYSFALVMILGGAVGNVIDRFRHGQVVDFLLFYWNTWYFPAFNAADSAITLGAILLIVDELRKMRRRT